MFQDLEYTLNIALLETKDAHGEMEERGVRTAGERAGAVTLH